MRNVPLFSGCLLAGLVLGCTSLAFAAAPATGDASSRVGTQNAIFEEYYQAMLKDYPELATSLGEYRYNSLLTDASLAAIARRQKESDAFLARLKVISTEGMAEQDQISHDLLVRSLSDGDEDYALKNYEMPVNQMSSPPADLADLPLSMPFDSVQHYEDYIARLKAIPRVLEQTTEVLRAGEKDGLMPVKAADVNETLAESETDRYISWPGQALGYKMGQLKIRELRARAKQELGPRFDIKAFHDEILNGGAMPLDMLDVRVTRWIARQKAGGAAAGE